MPRSCPGESKTQPNKTNNIMNYTHQQIDETTARIAFQFMSQANGSGCQPAIDRIYFNRASDPVIVPGFVLGPDGRTPCALIVDVKRRDLIVIRESVHGIGPPTRSFYCVDDSFRPQALDLPDPGPTYEEWLSLIQVSTGGDTGKEFVDDGIRAFMADSGHPDWLAQIVARQLGHWRAQEPELLIRFAPTSLGDDEIPRCVDEAPQVALAYLKDRLSDAQLARCIAKCPKDAIQYAFEHLTSLQVEEAVMNHPKDLLHHAAGQLSPAQLRSCATSAPYDAFCMRSGMSADRQAILLARSFDCPRMNEFDLPYPELQVEILNSLMDYPDEWLGCHQNDCELIFKKLWNYAKLKITPKQMLIFLRVMPEDQYEFLLKSMAAML